MLFFFLYLISGILYTEYQCKLVKILYPEVGAKITWISKTAIFVFWPLLFVISVAEIIIRVLIYITTGKK